MKTLHKALLAGGVTLAVVVPTAAAFADNGSPGPNGNGNGNGPVAEHVCTGDHDMHRMRAPDGTTQGNQHRSGPMDGSGPQADRPMDGTGNQWRAGR